MTIKNKYLVNILVWVLRLQMNKVDFTYKKELYDSDVTTLAFLNKVKGEFNEQVDLFNEELDAKIDEVSRKGL